MYVYIIVNIIMILDTKFIYSFYIKFELMIKFLKHILKFNNLTILNNLYDFIIKKYLKWHLVNH